MLISIKVGTDPTFATALMDLHNITGTSADFRPAAAGVGLESATPYYWRVSAVGTAVAARSRFATGLLDQKNDWRGFYIAGSAVPSAAGYRYGSGGILRRSFSLPPGVVLHAYTFLAAKGLAELRVNGIRPSGRQDVLSPALSQIEKRELYVSTDVTGLLVPSSNTAQHNNTLEIWLGRGFHSHYEYGAPAALLQLVAVIAGSGSTAAYKFTIETDSKWSALVGGGPIRDDDLFNGEVFDARRSPNSPGATWTRATVVAPPTPGITMSSQALIPPTSASTPIPFARKLQHASAGGSVVLDAGENGAGWTRLTVRGAPPVGARIQIGHSEMLNTNGDLANQ